MKKPKPRFHNSFSILIALVVFIIDQATKFITANFMYLGQSIPLINNVLHLTYVQNQGAGFGLMQGYRIFFIVFSFIVLAYLIFKWNNIPQEFNVSFPLGLALGGLFGNLIDRAIQGFVVDFIDFRIWPVFNIADSAISIGIVWIVIYMWKK
jgi:signal peptidase II